MVCAINVQGDAKTFKVTGPTQGENIFILFLIDWK
jgi:hypothetical protein